VKYFIADAFTDEAFKGNPAGVCFLSDWQRDDTMQNIAKENNFSETAFIVQRDGYWNIRWFTPSCEFDLCGHATLASAFVIMEIVEPGLNQVKFRSMSGDLSVTKEGGLYVLDFPSRPAKKIDPLPAIDESLGVRPDSYYLSRDHLVLLENAEQVRELRPDFPALRKVPDMIGLIATAKGDDCDFVSRYFAPEDAGSEDPVTGSAHCTLIPFWSERLGKTEMTAKQLSSRGGTLYCRYMGDRVKIGGNAVLYMSGEILIKETP
jgi:predicted PhzF superfamily epimerase YddE/YHI9